MSVLAIFSKKYFSKLNYQVMVAPDAESGWAEVEFFGKDVLLIKLIYCYY